MIDNLVQQYSTTYSAKQQKLEVNRLALKYLSSTNKDVLTNAIQKNPSSKRDSAEFSSESMALLKTKGSSSSDNTYALDFRTGAVQFDYTTQMYTLDDGTTFPATSIHPIDKSSCSTLIAENNNLIFNSNTYYNYSEVNGDSWLMAVTKEGISQAPSDRDFGNYTTEQTAATVNTYCFFSSLIENPYPIGLNTFYSRDEILDVMDNVGIKPGKFTIGIDDKVRTYYLCKDGTILSDEQVSNYRNAFNQANMFERGYTKDDVWLVDGVELRPDEQGHIHIPDNLGADIEVIRSNKIDSN